MTNHWVDFENSDYIMVLGGNPAENHPIGFRHMGAAIDYNNCKLIVVDPRFTRTAAKAHLYAPIRSGTDIAFLNGMIKRVLDLGPSVGGAPGYNEDYVLWYSNAGFILRNDFKGPMDQAPPLDGLFAGYTWGGSSPGTYSKTTWQYAKARVAYTTGTVNLDNIAPGGLCRLTGVGTAWSASNMKVGDLVTITTAGDPDLNKRFKITAADYVNQTLDMHRAAAGVVPRGGLTYNHEPFPDPNLDIVKDFWDANGDCKVHGAACPGGWKRSVLTCDGAMGLANWRAHLAAAGQLPANAGMTVWEETRRHMARYTTSLVSAITGCPQATFLQVADEYAKSGVPGKSACISYAMGTTQHTVGTQNIRGQSILQILLGNMGIAGGGIAAQRGESNVQGSTDFGLLFHIYPGYLPVADARQAGDATVEGYLNRTIVKTAHGGEVNWWGNRGKYFVSYLANMWDDLQVGNGTNNWTDANGNVNNLPPNIQTIYDRLPKIAADSSWISLFERMDAGNIKGMLCFGQNPSVSGPNTTVARGALRKLEWLVVSELWEQETAAFWQYDAQGAKLTAGQMALIPTEVFLLPAAAHLEKDGAVSNSGRWIQFRYKAVEPPGNLYTPGLGAMHEIKVINKLYDKLRALIPDPQIQQLNLGTHWYGTDDPLPEVLDGEINGYARAAYSATFGTTTKNYVPGNLVDSFAYLVSSGAASCANWVECAMYPGPTGWAASPPPGHGLIVPVGTNKSKLRGTTPGPIKAYTGWSWCWPVNRRIIYNRASVRPKESAPGAGDAGAPWDTGHPVYTYNNTNTADGFVAPWTAGSPTTWTGNDVIDGGFGSSALGAVKSPIEVGPFIMNNEGHSRLFGGFSMAEGPFPEHYEPLENPFAVPDIKGRGPNPVGHGQLVNPAAKIWRLAEVGATATYPIVCSTYRVTEHWQAGAQTRNLPWLVELVPGVFCEMSKELASSKGITNGGWVRVSTPRGYIKAAAVVTDRFKPFQLGSKTVHQVGVIWHFGYKGLATGHSGNLLTQHVGDANTMIPEYKAFRCKVEKW